MMMKRSVAKMNRRTALREINEKTLELLVSALKELKKDNVENFSARDISKLTGNYVLPKTIENSIDNDRGSYYHKERLSLIGKALMKAFPNKEVRLKRSYESKQETVVYTSEDGERFEKKKYVNVYYFSYDD
jgi:hypothetical protein